MSLITHPTYDQVQEACVSLVADIKGGGIVPDLLLGLTRGGLVPAVIISHLLGTPLIPINYSSKVGAGDNKNHHNDLPTISGKTVILIDDISDTSHTLNEVFSYYTMRKFTVFTAVLYYKYQLTGYVPDFKYWTIPTDSPFIYFPWEIK